MESFIELFKTQAPNHVAMFARLFSAALALQLLLGFREQLRYYDTQPTRIYGQGPRLLGFLQLPTVSRSYFIASGIILLTSLLCVVLNLFPRLFVLIALLSYFSYFHPIISLSYVQRKTNMLPLVLLILLVSPSLTQPLTSASTSWEITLVKIAIMQIYLSAGIRKILRSGWEWRSGKTLRAYLVQNYLWTDSKMAYRIAQNLGLCAAISWFTIIFELGFGLILFVPQLTAFFVVAALLFHLGTLMTMRINYLKYLSPVYMVFFTNIAFAIKDNLGY